MACIDAYDAYGSEDHINCARVLWDRLYAFQVLYAPEQGSTSINQNNSKINGACNGRKYMSSFIIHRMIYLFTHKESIIGGVLVGLYDWSV
jgi:hypothetical protein